MQPGAAACFHVKRLPGHQGGWRDIFADEVRGRIADADWDRVHFLGQIAYDHYIGCNLSSRISRTERRHGGTRERAVPALISQFFQTVKHHPETLF